MSKIIGVGPHYSSLLKAKNMELQDPLFLFTKPTTTLIYNGGLIELPESVDRVMAEVEIAIRINSTIKKISEQEAREGSFIDGFAISLDVTAQGKHVFGDGKVYDTFTPIGSFVQIQSPNEITIESYLNGQLQQSAVASEMYYSFEKIISYCSSIMTIEEGDIILTGTPATPFQINYGDIISLKSPELGAVSVQVASKD
jgi:2-keto-4-pentenoate hydratase/2-oxohepta-3-ene-1,7-dioic acid hydratase in catechol pathway